MPPGAVVQIEKSQRANPPFEGSMFDFHTAAVCYYLQLTWCRIFSAFQRVANLHSSVAVVTTSLQQLVLSESFSSVTAKSLLPPIKSRNKRKKKVEFNHSNLKSNAVTGTDQALLLSFEGFVLTSAS